MFSLIFLILLLTKNVPFYIVLELIQNLIKVGIDMSRCCDICGKGVQHGSKVSKSFNHTKRTWRPNLMTVKTDLGNGEVRTLKVCTRCFRSDFIVKKVRVPKPATTENK